MIDKEYLPIEKIRLLQEPLLSQTDFATKIGTTFRTYQGRLTGVQPEWKLEEIIKASMMNDGKILINSMGVDYKISIEKVVG